MALSSWFQTDYRQTQATSTVTPRKKNKYLIKHNTLCEILNEMEKMNSLARGCKYYSCYL
jgi:hypothetical protein